MKLLQIPIFEFFLVSSIIKVLPSHALSSENGAVISNLPGEKSKEGRQAGLQQPSGSTKETSAVLLGQMLRQFLEANFRRLSFELNATQANIFQELTMLQGLQDDVKTIQEVISQLDVLKKAMSDIKFVKDIFADTQFIKESQMVNSKKQIDTLLQLIQLSYSGALMVTYIKSNQIIKTRKDQTTIKTMLWKRVAQWTMRWEVYCPTLSYIGLDIGDVHDRVAKKQNCMDIRDGGKNVSDVYTIWPQGVAKPSVDVYCDMDIDGGGWTVIQRRGFGPYGTSRQINFNRTWEDYTNGFGNVSIDYWFGLENLRSLTRQCPYELLINLTNWEGENRYALYDRFYIGSSLDLYRLFVESHSGTAEDSFLYHHKKQFSTYDRDNDENWGESNGNCAETYGGGWWFGDCLRSHLNGKYFQNDGFLRKDSLNGIRWNSWTGMKESLKMTEMKIRPKCGFF